MLSLRPVHIKLPPVSHRHQLTSHPLNRRATFGENLTDANPLPAGPETPSDHPPPAICYLEEVRPPTPDIRRLFFSTRSPPVCGIGNDRGSNWAANPDASPDCTSLTGAFGAAWAAKDRSTGRLICLKVFRSLREPGVARSVQTELKLFRRMVKSKAGKRGKQFIMELNRSIQHDINVFFAMELMTTDLGMYLCIEPERCKLHARRLMAQMALGIQSLHEMGILHRDIKSENILIDSRENVRIIDFGLAYLNPTGKPLFQGTECAMDFLGTTPYMAPEVLRNKGMPSYRRRYYGITVDWWALGCILFELESQDHQLLFDTEEDVHAYVAWTQRACQFDATYARFEGLDPIVVSLLEGLLEAHPSDRYSLNDMEKHDYFLHHDGTSEFDNAAARALERPICPELVPQSTGEGEPVLVIQAAELHSMYDWTNMTWARL